MNILEVANLMVFYENALAINNLGLTVEKGRVVGVFGANSAGKSTLMYTLSGIILDVSKKERMKGGERISVMGSIHYNGEEISTMPAYRRWNV